MIGLRKFGTKWYVCHRDLQKEPGDIFDRDILTENHIVSGPFNSGEEASQDMIQNIDFYDPDNSESERW